MQTETSQLLLEAARSLNETLEIDRVYDRFHELLADVVQHNGVVVSSFDERERLIRCEYAWVDGNRVDPATLPDLELAESGGGMQSNVIRTGEPLLENDVRGRVASGKGTFYDVDRQGTVRKVPETGQTGVQAAMMVPVKHEGRVVGVVQVMSDEQTYDEEQLELVEALSAQMGAAVRTARLHAERRRAESAEAVPGWDAIAAQVSVAEGEDAPHAATLPVDVGGRELWLSFLAVGMPEGVVYAFRDQTQERELDRTKSDFIATVSHELRTPMTAVYGAARTLLRSDVAISEDQSRGLLEMIATQAERLAQITEDVLLASRLDRGDVSVEQTRVDVAQLARLTVETMRPHLDRAVSLDAEHATYAAGDPDRIQQILLNLIDNAAKFSPESGQISVSVSDRDSRVRVAVADEGIGIASDEHGAIFEKFYRVDPGLSQAPGGTGLGLYICRELARRMDGEISVDSEPGRGSTFALELPPA